MVKRLSFCLIICFLNHIVSFSQSYYWFGNPIAVNSGVSINISSVEQHNYHRITIRYYIKNHNQFPVAVRLINQDDNILGGQMKIWFKNENGDKKCYNPSLKRVIDRNGDIRLMQLTVKRELNNDFTIYNSRFLYPNESYEMAYSLDFNTLPFDIILGHTYDVQIEMFGIIGKRPVRSEFPYYYAGDLLSNSENISL